MPTVVRPAAELLAPVASADLTSILDGHVSRSYPLSLSRASASASGRAAAAELDGSGGATVASDRRAEATDEELPGPALADKEGLDALLEWPR